MPVKIGGLEYEPLPEVLAASVRMLVDIWEGMGKPQDPLSKPGERVMAAIIAVWEELYPEQVVQWRENRKDYKLAEMSTRDQVHQHTGRSLASYPFPVYSMMQKLFPTFKATERDNCRKLIAKFPMFQMANRV